MSKIQAKSSMALDALCFLQQRLLNDMKWMNADHIEEINNVNSLLPEDFDNECLGMSSLCLIISTYYDSDLEAVTLDDLIRVFQSPERISQIVRIRTRSDFTASYLFPMLDWLNEGYAKKYVEKLKVLKSVGFETVYRERILPSVREEIARVQKDISIIDAEELFRNISQFKNVPIVDHTDIYVSFFSWPVSFVLYGGSFLICISSSGNSVDYYPFIAHELMHGFASDETIHLYRKLIESNEHLKKCHFALIEDYKEGDEEEFVIAAECFLCYLSGHYPIDQLKSTIKGYYGGNCPTAAAIFEMLIKEREIPNDYNDWLIHKFFKNYSLDNPTITSIVN